MSIKSFNFGYQVDGQISLIQSWREDKKLMAKITEAINQYWGFIKIKQN